MGQNWFVIGSTIVRVAALALLVGPVWAGERVVRLDPQRTRIAFTLGATTHTVHGTLTLQRGELRFDEASGRASGEIVVDAASAATGNARRDRKMHATVLESATYPTFVYRPRRVLGSVPTEGSAELHVEGTLVIHGAEHPLELPVTLDARPDGLHVRAAFPIPYVAWGLHDPSFFLLRVAKSVDVEVEGDIPLADLK